MIHAFFCLKVLTYAEGGLVGYGVCRFGLFCFEALTEGEVLLVFWKELCGLGIGIS